MTTTRTAIATPDRLTRCRYLSRGAAGQCTAESLFGEDSDVMLCGRHAAELMEQIRFRIADLAAGQ